MVALVAAVEPRRLAREAPRMLLGQLVAALMAAVEPRRLAQEAPGMLLGQLMAALMAAVEPRRPAPKVPEMLLRQRTVVIAPAAAAEPRRMAPRVPVVVDDLAGPALLGAVPALQRRVPVERLAAKAPARLALARRWGRRLL